MRLNQIATPDDTRTRRVKIGTKGEWVCAINDQSGELEIWRYAADGSDKKEQLTFGRIHATPDSARVELNTVLLSGGNA